MIKLQDFARQQGVTDRAIQKHLKTYAAELEGLFQRKGPNGTWLTEEACEILRSKMKQAPVVLVDNQAQMDLAAAKAKIEMLQEERVQAARKLEALYEWQANKAQLIAEAEQTQRLLQAAQDEKKLLEGTIEEMQADMAVLSDERDDAKVKAYQSEEASQKAQNELLRAEEEKEAWKQYAMDLAAYEAMSKWQRWRQKAQKPAPPFSQEAVQEVEPEVKQEEEHGTAED